jgi:hypothetical protein
MIAPNFPRSSIPSPAKLICLLLCFAQLATLVPQTHAQKTTAQPTLEISVGANNTLVIPKSALGKEHLLSVSRIPQALAATSTGLSGKIVRFELFADGVDLYESTEGLVVTKDLPARRLMTTFPIVEQDGTKVVIDFNRGMRRLYTDIWYDASRRFDPVGRDETLEIPQARVFSATKQDNQIVIRQSVQVRNRQFSSNLEQQFEVRYFLTPYVSGGYSGKEAPASDLRYARFFESQAQLEESTGRSSPKMARFDLSKPVVFHYSANTPADYVQAVKDGILYWNRAFGTNIVRAEKAPDGVTAPDPRYNIVQWVPWDAAGSAYADILIDPRTGESRHGQAYMTSVFALSGKARARALLRAMRDLAAEKADGKKDKHDAFGGWPATGGVCEVNMAEFAAQYAQGLQELLANDGLTDEAALLASQDYVREVVAHEVGHIMGLRHNFAGSLAATLDLKELDDWFKAYVAGDKLDAYTNRYASSSIMEYTVFKAAVQVGWFIRTQPEALPHDKAAIQWGYFNSESPREGRLLFGTDDQVGTYGDLQRFDVGADPVVAAYSQMSDNIRLLPNNVIETFIAAKAPRDPRDRVPLAEVNLWPTRDAISISGQFSSMLGWFNQNARSLRVEQPFDFIGDLNQKNRAEAHWKSLNDQVERLGGVDRAFFSFLPVDLKLDLKEAPKGVGAAEKVSATNLLARLKTLLAAPAYTNFVGLDEKRYSFTPEEKELILKRGQSLFEDLEKELVKQACVRLETVKRDLGGEVADSVAEDDITAKLEQRIIDLAKLVLTAKDDGKRLKGKVDKSIVEVLDFKYDDETRLAAAKALNDNTGSFKGWATDAKGDLNKQLKDDMEGALNIGNFKDFKDSMLSRTLREWYMKQQEILKLLPPKAGQPPK